MDMRKINLSFYTIESTVVAIYASDKIKNVVVRAYK